MHLTLCENLSDRDRDIVMFTTCVLSASLFSPTAEGTIVGSVFAELVRFSGDAVSDLTV